MLYVAAVAVNIANGQNDNNGNDNGVYNVGTSPPHALGLHCVVRPTARPLCVMDLAAAV